MVELIALWCHRKAAQNVKIFNSFFSSLLSDFHSNPSNTLLGRKMNFQFQDHTDFTW